VEEAVGNAQLITFIYQHWADQFYKQIELASFVHWPYQRMYRLLSNDDVTVDVSLSRSIPKFSYLHVLYKQIL
jgi:hypothetical protein